MLSEAEIIALQSERKYFIENGAQASLYQWLTSKGTNFTCYIEYLNSLDREQDINNKIDIIRTIIYALHKPIQFTFFYWTLLIFILHKFNFKKPVMKIVLAHFVLRSLGDVINKFGDLFSHYYANSAITDADGNVTGYTCSYFSPNTEMHPFKWFLTRQIGCIFWCCGEIVADWYPLLRTKAVAREQKSIWLVYLTCGLFNLSKVMLILYHYCLSPTELYDSHGVYDKSKVDLFYFIYWIIHLIIIYASVVYDYSVYYVIKKSFSQLEQLQYGFLKKFKTISEYRILVSAVVCVIFLPIVSFTIIIKYYYYYKYGYHNLEFSFDEIRQSINNVQYFMIFIDQILLIRSSDESSKISSRSNNSSNNYTFNQSISKLNFKSSSSATLTNSGNNYNMDYGYGTLKKSTNNSSHSINITINPTTPTSPSNLLKNGVSLFSPTAMSPKSSSSTLSKTGLLFKNTYATLPNTDAIVNNNVIFKNTNTDNMINNSLLFKNNSNNQIKKSEEILNNTYKN
eukprot:jgi/Orpsp1_1/1177330/evm.model.c7180000061026.1